MTKEDHSEEHRRTGMMTRNLEIPWKDRLLPVSLMYTDTK